MSAFIFRFCLVHQKNIISDGPELEVHGVLACGDVRDDLLRQIVTAIGYGAPAAMSAEKYLSR